MQRIRKTSFKSKVESELEILNKNSGRLTRFFTEDRHAEILRGNNEYSEDREIWKKYSKDRMKTVSVALVFCLHIGVDPPDPVPKPNPCAKLEGWIDPFSCNPQRALNAIAAAVQKSYERWQPRARYKYCTDPTSDDVKKLCLSMRRNAKEERVLFHYNGHGVPRPTSNGEIWVFNKNYTQYIPLSLYDLQTWIDYPAIYVWDCNSAETIIKTFNRYSQDTNRTVMEKLDEENVLDLRAEVSGESEAIIDCIQLAACGDNERLPTNPLLPADLFTSCLTTPIQTSILMYLIKTGRRSQFPDNIIDLIPGSLGDRKTVLGELNWVFTAITDTIAWSRLPKETFQRLFRQDLLLASLFRSYILAQKIMAENGCRTVSVPSLPLISDHPLWESWEYTLDQTMSYLYNTIILPKQNFDYYVFPREDFGKDILYAKSVFCGNKVFIDVEKLLNNNEIETQHNVFFVEQLTAFEVWLEYCARKDTTPPQQLPIVLQVLLSQAHRLRALELLARFLDLGQWAVVHALAVGVFPYVQKLLQSNTKELRQWLAFIWAKILAVDPSCQVELFKENGDDNNVRYDTRPKNMRYYYFIQILNDPDTTPRQKIVPAFILATLFHNNFQIAQENLTRKGYVNLCTELLGDPAAKSCRLLKLWVLIGLGRLWADYDAARWQAVRLNAHPKVQAELDDQHPEVRAAAVYALGCLIKNRSANNEHASFIDQELCDVLCNKCSLDGSCLVRVEVVVALQWYIIDFERNFIKVLLAILSRLEIDLETYEEDMMDEGLDIASVMGKPSKARSQITPPEQFFHTLKPPATPQRDSSTTINIDDVMIHEDAWVSATKAEEEFRKRCEHQILFLQAKNFLESNERVWLSMLLLALDAHIKVASMGRAVIRYIESMAVTDLVKTKRKLSERSLTDNQLSEKEPVTSRSVIELSSVFQKQLYNIPLSPPPESEYKSDEPEDPDRASSPSSSGARTTSSVLFTVGSPAVNSVGAAHSIETPLAPPTRKFSMPVTSSTPRIRSNKSETEHRKIRDMARNVIESVYTPKRVTKGELGKDKEKEKKDYSHKLEETHQPIITSDFVEWCSRVFVNPILEVINGDDHEDENGERQIPNVIPTDWAFHTREGLIQTSLDEFSRLKSDHYFDNVVATIENPHENPVTCMAMSFLRKIVYICDARRVATVRFEALPVMTKNFNVLGANPYTDDKICSLEVINEMSKEMLLCGSKKGVIRIWDCHYDVHSHSLDLSKREPLLVACAMPLCTEIERHPSDIEYIQNNKGKPFNAAAYGFHRASYARRKLLYDCIYEWRQDSGHLLCGGNTKVVRVWSAQTERATNDIVVAARCGRVTALSAAVENSSEEIIGIGFRSGAVHIHDLRASEIRSGVLRNEERTNPVVGCFFTETKCTAVDSTGYVHYMDPRMFREPFDEFQLAGSDDINTVKRHIDDYKVMACISRSFSSTSKSPTPMECKIYDANKIYDADKKKRVLPSVASISSHHSGGSQSNVTALTLHKIRTLIAVADEKNVTVYGPK